MSINGIQLQVIISVRENRRSGTTKWQKGIRVSQYHRDDYNIDSKGHWKGTKKEQEKE